MKKLTLKIIKCYKQLLPEKDALKGLLKVVVTDDISIETKLFLNCEGFVFSHCLTLFLLASICIFLDFQESDAMFTLTSNV